jgi:hypothetical protein
MKRSFLFSFHFILLLLFFVLHGYNENYPFVSFSVAAVLFLNYLLYAVIIFLLGLLVFRSPVKSGIFVFIIFSLNFFFGSFKDWLKSIEYLQYLSRYRVLLSAILLIVILCFVVLKRSKGNFNKLSRGLFVLMLVFISLEIFYLFGNASAKPEADETQVQVSDAPKPDIYFVVLDAYAGSKSLQEVYKFDNTALDDTLRSLGFFVCRSSHSNYNFTPFSVASTLNMKYLDGIGDVNACTVEDYARRGEEIKDNAVGRFLMAQGYEVINYSVFDIEGQPSLVSETFLPVKGRLISDQTLLNRMKKDLYHMLVAGKFSFKIFEGDVFRTMRDNKRLISLTVGASLKRSKSPRFIFTHLYMPHAPYYYDRGGRLKDAGSIVRDDTENSIDSYIDNLVVTNGVVKRMVNTIQKNSNYEAVIILTGDHGYRPPYRPADVSSVFNTLSAVYIPGGRYERYYDSLSNVNFSYAVQYDL